MQFTTSIFNLLLNSLSPSRCLLCKMLLDGDLSLANSNNDHTIICIHCQLSFPEIETSCSRCNTPLNTHSELCGICLKQERYWQQCTPAFSYSSSIADLILLLKHQNNNKLTEYFAQTIIEAIDEYQIESCDFLIPVPMHPKRFAKRGFNQSLQLTKALSLITGIPYINIFKKNEETPQQASLSKKQRETALKNNFHLKQRFLSILNNKRLVLIDDVVTTGATTSELARTLKIAKAKRVDVWCIART